MLKADEINALRDAATELTQPITDYLLRDLAQRIAAAGQMTATAQYEVWKLQQLGMSQREVKKQLKKLLKVSNRELRQLLAQSAETGYNYDIRSLPQVQAIPFHRSEIMQQIVSAAVSLAQDNLANITQTLGMVDPYGNAQPLQEAYRKCMDYAFMQVSTGAADYTTAIREATKNLAEKGVVWIDYESGVHTSLEAAVRRNVMGGLGLMQEQISQHVHDDLGANGWEIDAHSNSAPDHEPIQGKQYSDAAYTALNNSLVRRIGTLNCGHSAHPIILGVSPPQYTPAELEQMRQKNEDGITYNGRHYSGYEATQRQRNLEAAMRRQKRRILVGEATGDAEKLQTDQIKLQMLRQEYARFSKSAKLRTQAERAETAGFGWKQANAAKKATEKAVSEVLANAESHDIIVLSEDMESIIAEKPFSQIRQLSGKLSDRAARKWYLAQDSKIPGMLDETQSIESRARRACELRNENRTRARDLMRDQEKRRQLDISDPNLSFENLVASKMRRKGLTKEEAIADILNTATKTRKTVNKSLGLE